MPRRWLLPPSAGDHLKPPALCQKDDAASTGDLGSAPRLNAVARTLRTQTRDFDDLPPSAPARRESASLERSAARALRVGVVAGLVAMYLS